MTQFMTAGGDDSRPPDIDNPAAHEVSAARTPGTLSARDQARRRLQKKREFQSNLVAYVVINTFLVVVWLITGRGYFWPAWVLAGWGIGLVLHAWELYFRQPITEQDIDRELRGRTR